MIDLRLSPAEFVVGRWTVSRLECLKALKERDLLNSIHGEQNKRFFLIFLFPLTVQIDRLPHEERASTYRANASVLKVMCTPILKDDDQHLTGQIELLVTPAFLRDDRRSKGEQPTEQHQR